MNFGFAIAPRPSDNLKSNFVFHNPFVLNLSDIKRTLSVLCHEAQTKASSLRGELACIKIS